MIRGKAQMIFISYASTEKALADRIRKQLTERGLECWMAPESILPGSNYADDIPLAISSCSALLVILSGESQKSIWVPKELDMAFNLHKTIIPLHVDESPITLKFQFYFSNVQQVDAHKELNTVLNTVADVLLGVYRTPNASDVKSSLPEKVSLYDLLKIHSARKLDIGSIRGRNDVTQSLAVPVGLDEQGEPVFIDIHHKADGPTGICYGPSGSGKTEFINTLLLSLALHFSPQDICFYLTDFQHGTYDTLKTLPHMAGSFTDIDSKNEASAFLNAILSEKEKREKLLQESRTENIYQYLKKRKASGYTLPPMPHILIAIDELASLKREWPDIVYEITRLGESNTADRYGYHILFCTSRPAAVVNDAIFHILSFQVCSNMVQNIEYADNLQSELRRPGRLFFASPALEAPRLIQVAYSGDKAFLPTISDLDMNDMGWSCFARRQNESITGAIARYELD